MRALLKKLRLLALLTYAGLAALAFAPVASHILSPPAYASPFGQGVFGAQVPFGGATSLIISLGGNVNLNLTSNGSQYSATGSHTITVKSTDPVGYAIYAYALNSSTMTSTNGATIPASSNSSPAALAINTWGYNLDGSSNFLGMGTTPTLITQASGPYENGNNTTVTYGVVTNLIQAAGSYTVSVVYTVAALSE